eukprot:9428178-Pyramimonas_sp.AAC.1
MPRGNGIDSHRLLRGERCAPEGHRGVEADMTWSKRPHRPVMMKIVDNGMKVQHFVYTVTPTLPLDQTFGPRKQPTN